MSEVERKKQPTGTENKLAMSIKDTVTKGALFVIGTVVVIVVVIVIKFNVAYTTKNYDIELSAKNDQKHSYGIKYKQGLQLWKFKKEKDGSSYEKRIYP